jgi:hypothetical protein
MGYQTSIASEIPGIAVISPPTTLRVKSTLLYSQINDIMEPSISCKIT